MSASNACPDGDCATVGIDAAPIEEFADLETVDSEVIVHDPENEEAWIQSDVYFPRTTVA